MKIGKVLIALTILIQFSCQKDDILPKTGYEEVTFGKETAYSVSQN